ncbi:transposase [Lachnospiraceae bacterium OttesenSCG-928-J05]|nr:transposase [Lachnospiraceae bacterium OttesenSCG-928-J05]
MTLKEAYELLRREVLALRKENSKLKTGTYIDADRKAHEKRIKQLERELANKSKEADRYHDLWRKGRYSSDLLDELASVKKQLKEALAIIAKLKAQMNRNHENSSLASSQKPFRKKIKNSRKKTERKPGGQHGHIGYKRPHLESTAPVITLPVPKSITNNTDFYPTNEFITKQVADIEVNVIVTEYKAQVYRSHSTGRRVHAPFPKGVINEFNYGENTKALAFLLNNYCNVSIDKTSELISGLTNEKIILSKGLINSLPKQFSIATEEERQKIFSLLLMAPYMHTDATPGKVNGKTVQVFVCANHDEILYSFREHKGHQGIKDTPIEIYQQTLIHDHDVTFYNYGNDHQECLAHVLRYLQDSIENEPALKWNTSMKALLSAVIHEVKQDRNLSKERILEIEMQYDDILYTAEREYDLHPPNKYYRDGLNLALRLKEYRDNHLLFLHRPEIEYTNNISERALRKFKRKFKQAVTFRSNESVELLCNCMSILETRRLQGCNLYATAKDGFLIQNSTL